MIQRSVSTWLRGMSRTKLATYSSAGEPTSSSRRAELDDRAVPHDRDPVAEPERLGEVVRDEDHRLADLCLQPDHLVLHVAADQRIERAERLVVEHHLRVDREGAGEADALLHAAGELVRELIRRRPRGRPGGASRSARVEPLRLGHALHLEPERDVVDHAAVREQAEVLEHHRDRVPAEVAEAVVSAAVTSRPSISIVPAVGSISRISVRTSVDLPEPESP